MPRLVAATAALLLTLAPACGGDDGTPGPPRRGADKLRELDGKTEAAIRDRLGEPTRTKTFTMAECCHEFEIELYNTYPPDDPATATVPIQEWTYDYDGYALTLWLHAPDPVRGWVVLNNIRYDDDIRF